VMPVSLAKSATYSASGAALSESSSRK
jgi:hypothetical protein